MKATILKSSKSPATSSRTMESRSPFVSYLVRLVGTSLCGIILCLAIGCATTPIDTGVTGPFHEVENFHLTDRRLPTAVRRVAVLPLTSSENDQAARSGRESLKDILYGELIKSRLFQAVLMSPEETEQYTGKTSWRPDDELPADFLVRIREAKACDAILFNQLTVYRPYPPLAIGWRMQLVSSEDGRIIWSVDEVFDAGNPSVWNSARRYSIANERTHAEFTKQLGTKEGSILPTRVVGMEWLNSPRHFAKYAANAAFETMATK